MKDLIDEVGHGFLDQATIDNLSTFIVELYSKSDLRIIENNECLKKTDDEEDEDDMQEDEDLIKEEN